MTYNMAHGRGLTPVQGLTSARKIRANLRSIARLLQAHAPDVVALQEVDECSRWAGNFDHLEYLRLHAGFPYAVFGINNRRPGLLNLSYGNAILSRHPIVESENVVFGSRRIGEKGFLYYSNEGKAIVGIVEVCKLAHRDSTSDVDTWDCVDIRALAKAPKPVTLDQIKADRKLSAMVLVTNSRLSVQPVTAAEWAHISGLAGLPA